MKLTLNYAQYQYLKENGLLEHFKNALDSSTLGHLDEVDFLEDDNFIQTAFIWDKTDEGYAFWKNYSDGAKNLHHNDTYTLETK